MLSHGESDELTSRRVPFDLEAVCDKDEDGEFSRECKDDRMLWMKEDIS
jgi:hypothetical protein